MKRLLIKAYHYIVVTVVEDRRRQQATQNLSIAGSRLLWYIWRRRAQRRRLWFLILILSDRGVKCAYLIITNFIFEHSQSWISPWAHNNLYCGCSRIYTDRVNDLVIQVNCHPIISYSPGTREGNHCCSFILRIMVCLLKGHKHRSFVHRYHGYPQPASGAVTEQPQQHTSC